MHTTALNIGRNINTTPLAEQAWQTFVQLVAEALQDASTEPVEILHGQGSWQGVVEDAASIKTRTAAPITELQEVVERVAKLAALFGQDAVAVEQGTSTLHTGVQHA